MTKNWFLYLIRDKDNRLYCGITIDVTRRFQQHCHGTGAKALRGKMPLTLVFSSPAGDRCLASQLEYRLKQLTKCQKETLIRKNPKNIERYLMAFTIEMR